MVMGSSEIEQTKRAAAKLARREKQFKAGKAKSPKKTSGNDKCEGAHSSQMTKTVQTRTGGYGGLAEFDELDLVPIERDENSALMEGRRAFLARLSELQQKYPEHWVVFHRDTFLNAVEEDSEIFDPIDLTKIAISDLYIDYVFTA